MVSRLLNNRVTRFVERHPIWTLAAIGLTIAGTCILSLVFVWLMVDQGGVRFEGRDYIQFVNDTPEVLAIAVCESTCVDQEADIVLSPGRKFLSPGRGSGPVFWAQITQEDGTIFGCLRFEYPLYKVYVIGLSSAIACPDFSATPASIVS